MSKIKVLSDLYPETSSISHEDALKELSDLYEELGRSQSQRSEHEIQNEMLRFRLKKMKSILEGIL